MGEQFGLAGRLTGISHFLMRGGKTDEAGDDYDWIYDLNGVGVGVSARWYPGGNAPAGFNLGLRMDYNHYVGTYEDRAHNEAPVDARVSAFLIHGELGYKFIIANTIVIAPFLDAGLPLISGADDGANLMTLFTFIAGGGLYIGWAF
ncbi:MAG: hypothetical protein AB1439_12315 [candidate division FCPU426 bacterium]